MGFSCSSSISIGGITCVDACVSAVQTHTHTHCTWRRVLSVHCIKHESNPAHAVHTLHQLTHTPASYEGVFQLCCGSYWLETSHTHRSERIPVTADRIVNVIGSDGRPSERCCVRRCSFTWRESGGREESFILAAARKRLVHWVQAQHREKRGEPSDSSRGGVRVNTETGMEGVESYLLHSP